MTQMQITITQVAPLTIRTTITGAEMVGTPKQIAWATDIRQKLIHEIVVHFVLGCHWDVDTTNIKIAKTARGLQHATDAKRWIDAYCAAESNIDFTLATKMLPAMMASA